MESSLSADEDNNATKSKIEMIVFFYCMYETQIFINFD